MLQQGGRYYLFTSQDKVPQNVPVRSGTSVGQWGAPTDALPDPPAWAEPGVMWAPDVAQFGHHFLLYFTSQLKGVSPSTMCIGDAISTAVAGPYIASPVPFICQQSLGGSIDPRVFDDADGQPYMIWKSDQNARSNTVDTQIYSQPLSADGVHLVGQPTAIFSPDESWQGHIVEAPQLVLVRGAYYLFYSGGWFNQPGYSIGAARCSRTARTVQRPIRRAAARLELPGPGPGRGIGLRQCGGLLAALHALQLHAAASRTAPAGLHGAPRLRDRQARTWPLRWRSPGRADRMLGPHAAQPRMRPRAGRADGEGPGDAPAVPPHHQRPPGGLQPDLQPGAGGRYDETTVLAALDELKDRKLVRFVLPSHGRSVVRYRQVLDETLALDARQCAVLAVLLLRGPQTIGELRIRTERMAKFDSLDEIDHELDLLHTREEPLAHNVGRRPGQKEERWATTLVPDSRSGSRLRATRARAPGTRSAPIRRPLDDDLRAELEELRAEVADLRHEVQELRHQPRRLITAA